MKHIRLRGKPIRGQFLIRVVLTFMLCLPTIASGQTPEKTFTRADILRGSYGPYRSNNDLLSNNLDIRVDPDRKFISGKNTIRFKMLAEGSRIQLDLYANMKGPWRMCRTAGSSAKRILATATRATTG